MKIILKIFFRLFSGLFIFVILTLLTQVGGVIYLISLALAKKWKKPLRFKRLLVFLSLYGVVSLLIVPLVAPVFGREKVAHSDKIKPTNYLTVLFNRNYVRPQLNQLLSDTATKLEGTNLEIHYLDANFPFVNRFPLLPHLSHNDGKKIDISFIYETEQGIIIDKQKSVSGYGAFENPRPNKHNQTNACLQQGYSHYDYPKYLTLGKINGELRFSQRGTKILIEKLLTNKALGKLFIEPHLKKRMKLTNNKVRYQGCRAVRHDDHIHIQLK